MVELFVIDGACAGTVFFLPDVPTVVGRSPESHVQLADPWVSSMHALFERRGEQLWVVDLDSRNGTFVEDRRVHEAPVAPGSRVRFGRTSAELRQQQGSTAGESVALSDQRTIFRYVADLEPEPSTTGGDGETQGEPPAPDAHPEALRPLSAARRQVSVLNELGRSLLGARDLP